MSHTSSIPPQLIINGCRHSLTRSFVYLHFRQLHHSVDLSMRKTATEKSATYLVSLTSFFNSCHYAWPYGLAVGYHSINSSHESPSVCHCRNISLLAINYEKPLVTVEKKKVKPWIWGLVKNLNGTILGANRHLAVLEWELVPSHRVFKRILHPLHVTW